MRAFAVISRTTLSAVALAVMVSQALAQEAVEKPELKIGDRWVVRATDLRKNEDIDRAEFKITGLAGDNIDVSRTVLSSRFAETVGRTMQRKADRATWTFANASILEGKYVAFAFPLKVGNKWDYEYRMRNREGGPTTYTMNANVEAAEEVVVPAGTFKALKVVHSGVWNSGKWTGTLTETLWYSPQTRWWVKRELTTRTALGVDEQTRSELMEVNLQ